MSTGCYPWYAYEPGVVAATRHNAFYVLYFCPANSAATAGEGAAAIAEYKKNNSGSSPAPTVFESDVLRTWFEASKLEVFIKIPDVEENKNLYRNCNMSSNTLVIYTPTAEKLVVFSGPECNDKKIIAYLKDEFRIKSQAWMKLNEVRMEDEKNKR
jgi:hypothetical protein